MKRSVRLLAPLLVACASSGVHASVVYYVSTGIQGALAPIDSANSQYWEFAVSATVNDFGGGNFTMKQANNNSSAGITFTLYEGTWANRLTAPVLMAVTRPATGPNAVGTTYSTTTFGTGSAVTLLAGRTYTVALTSSAATNASYSIKGGSDVPLGWVDGSGTTVPDATVGAAVTTESVPAPGAAVLLAMAGFGARSRRRRT